MSRPQKIRDMDKQYSRTVGVGNIKDPLAGIDLKKEYDLIMKKKSKLNARDRRRVIAQIEYDKKREKK